jgi:serine/threonine protein kinase
VLHRDLKPSNALVSAAGRVKLADFGLARSLDSGQSLAESFVGTFDYMSPERWALAAARPHRPALSCCCCCCRLTGEAYSLLADVWSLGITLYAVGLGRHPFEGRKGYWELVHATQVSRRIEAGRELAW